MLALCARYQVCPRGSAIKDIHSCIAMDGGAPPRPPLRATASQPSRSNRSFAALHHGLPGDAACGGASTPRASCQCMKAVAARR
jgi:hypothetical protein